MAYDNISNQNNLDLLTCAWVVGRVWVGVGMGLVVVVGVGVLGVLVCLSVWNVLLQLLCNLFLHWPIPCTAMYTKVGWCFIQIYYIVSATQSKTYYFCNLHRGWGVLKYIASFCLIQLLPQNNRVHGATFLTKTNLSLYDILVTLHA